MPVDRIVMVVEDAFAIQGRGVLLSPALDVNRLPQGTRLNCEVIDSAGSSRRVGGRFGWEHLRLLDGGSKWQGVITLDDDAGTVKPGSTVIAEVAEGSQPR